MMKNIIALAISLCVGMSYAAPNDVKVQRTPFGSGTQNVSGLENANVVGELGVYHAPQYMPGYPTSSTIWPRVIDVECQRNAAELVCGGYKWSPELGRGEYLFIRPRELSPKK